MLYPVIIPRRYNVNNKWIGPMRNLKHPELAITWADVEGGGMSYLTFEEGNKYKDEGINYHELSLDNLWENTCDMFYTGSKKTDGKLKFVVCMHKDGLGSSRLLFLPEWAEEFSQGCKFALPERSCAIVIPSPEENDAETLELVRDCYHKGTVQMLPGIYDPVLFELEDA